MKVTFNFREADNPKRFVEGQTTNISKGEIVQRLLTEINNLKSPLEGEIKILPTEDAKTAEKNASEIITQIQASLCPANIIAHEGNFTYHIVVLR